ncbi:MAG: DUF4388 domain-containing protein [Polyangiales bacterium]
MNDRPSPIDAGRMAGLFCQLQRERWDGIIHVSSGTQTASIGFRAGTPVTYADPTQGHTLGEALVEQGQLTRSQYSQVIARMTDDLVEDEAVAFCEHAIQLGYLTEQDAIVELSHRVRTRLIQVMAWTDCQVDFEPGPLPSELREFPQSTGALVYMGVRTFYEEDYLEHVFPRLEQTYLRLTSAPATISHFFGLDDDEFQLLRRVDPEKPITALLEKPGVERAHVLGLVMLLRLSELGELASTPHVPPPITQLPPVAPERPASRNIAKPPPDDTPSVSTAKPGVDATHEALLEAAARTARTRKPLTARRPMTETLPVEPTPHTTPHASPAARANAAAVSGNQPDAGKPAVQPAPVSPPGRALSTPFANTSLPEARNPAPEQPKPDYAKAHLNELIARRKQNAPPPEAANSGKREPVRDLRQARELLRDQQYVRAEDVLRTLAAQEPENTTVRAYHLWSQLRAQVDMPPAQVEELRGLAKKLAQDAEHAAFGSYVLGHMFFSEKRDDLAEKFFKRALGADRTNKDAERHVLILERRKQLANEAARAPKGKLFGIQISQPKKS